MQYRSFTPSVRRRHTISKKEGKQYKFVTALVPDKGVQYRISKTA